MRGVILKTCQEAEPIKQNSASVLSQHLILCYNISTANILRRGMDDQGLVFFFLHTYTLKSVSPHRRSETFYLIPFKVHILSAH